MTVGGVDSYYDYDERHWKFRRPRRRARPARSQAVGLAQHRELGGVLKPVCEVDRPR
jgi:hypothetical protein